jgi:hypothetical protein
MAASCCAIGDDVGDGPRQVQDLHCNTAAIDTKVMGYWVEWWLVWKMDYGSLGAIVMSTGSFNTFVRQ